ncbi:Copia protein [Fusarium oxysporum f. sp. conglutinans]|nr:Copia protein [Fusarium oxysporum f. sp. conglutinans]
MRNRLVLRLREQGWSDHLARWVESFMMERSARLAEFLINPSDYRQQAADRLIRYFYATRYLAIQYSGKGPTSPTRVDEINRSLAAQVSSNQSSDLQIASDAAFADDPLTRKSSQGSILSLFGGLVSWKSGKQDTVTTSSTEAELLAFTHIAKQAIATKRLFDQLDLQLDQLPIIEYGNEQTIRLILLDAPRIKTAIKHIDVHNCWARQAYQGGSSDVQFTPTAQMVADGLTKALSARKFQTFNRQLGLTDIRSLIELQDKSDVEDN